MQKSLKVVAVSGILALSGCGDTLLEQGLLGAGAGVGAATVLGGNAKTAALVGAGVNIFCQNHSNQC